MKLFLDIETLPSEDATVIADIAASITAPGNYRNADSIAKWEAENKAALVEETVRKTAFDATFGRVCCIGWAFEDQAPQAKMMTGNLNEANLLTQFCEDVRGRASKNESRLEVVGHNVSWDLRFLLQRCIVNAVKPPHTLMAAMQAKPWGESIRDTMLMWHPDRDRRISLDKLCKVLGVPTSKGDMDGSKVYDAYRAGEFDKIATYCADDVDATRKVFNRLTFE